jgi:hypothetical protein
MTMTGVMQITICKCAALFASVATRLFPTATLLASNRSLPMLKSIVAGGN